MTTFITDIQPILLTALVGVLVAYARYVNSLKTRVAVLERTIEDLQKYAKKVYDETYPEDAVFTIMTLITVRTRLTVL